MRKRFVASIMLAALLAVPAVGLASDERLQAGVATVDITWHPGAGQTGFGERWRPYHTDEQGIETNMYARLMKPSEGVHMRLRTKALVIDDGDGDGPVAIVSNDLLGTIQIFHRGVADLIAEDPGISWDNLMIVGTHSESVPSNGSVSPLITAYADVFDEEFYRYIVERVAAAIKLAHASMEPVTFAVGTTQGGNMIETYVNGNVSEYLDDDLGVARIDRLDGTPMAALLTYAGHFVLGGNESRLISSDGPGYWERMVEAAVPTRTESSAPFTAIYLTGPTGDSDVRSVGQPNLYAEGEKKALNLLSPTLSLFDDLGDEGSREVPVDSVAIRLSPPEEHEVPNFPLLGGAPIPFMVSHRMHTQLVRIGDLALGGVPGEPVMALGKTFKDEVKKLGFAHPFMLSHANDWTGYIFTPEQYEIQQGRANQGAYGANQGVYIVEKLVAMAHHLLNPDFRVDGGAGGVLQALDEPYYEAWTDALLSSAPITQTVRDLAVVPNIVLTCEGLQQPTDVTRFGETRFTWRGGNNAVDTPRVELQLRMNDTWTTVATDDSFELQTWLEVYKARPAAPYLPGTTPGCNELADQQWSAAYQPAYGAPTGTYRLRATGVFRTAPGVNEAYEAISEPFDVTTSDALTVTDLVVDGTSVTFRVAYPNGEDAWRYRPSFVPSGNALVYVDGVLEAAAAYNPASERWEATTTSTGDVTVAFTDDWGNAGS